MTSYPVNRISLITLAAQDLDGLSGFYAKLGWVSEFRSEDVVFYDLGGLRFGLYRAEKLAADLNTTVEDLGKGAMTLTVNFGGKKDVDVAYGTAIESGGTALKQPDDIFWGGYTGSWADPEGHVWEYAWNPFWKLDENGRLTGDV